MNNDLDLGGIAAALAVIAAMFLVPIVVLVRDALRESPPAQEEPAEEGQPSDVRGHAGGSAGGAPGQHGRRHVGDRAPGRRGHALEQ